MMHRPVSAASRRRWFERRDGSARVRGYARQAATSSTTPARTTPARTTTVSAAPVVNIQPLPVRPADALVTCDLGKTTLYTLGPEALKLILAQVESPSPLTSGFYEVTLTLDAASAVAWASFTTAHLHDHVAFVRDDLVLEAPIIEEPVASGRIALTTQTAQAADQLTSLAGRPA